MPISRERISPLLDEAARLRLITCWQGREVEREDRALAARTPEALARCVAGWHVDILLCAAVSGPLLRELERLGVQVQPHLCGEAGAVLQAFSQNRLHRPEFRMPGCQGRHAGKACCRMRRALRLLKINFNQNPP